MNKPILIVAGTFALAFAGISVWRVLQDDGPSPPPRMEAAENAVRDERQRKADFWNTYREATEHRMGGRRTEAAEAYERALLLDPDHQDALYYLGNILADLRRYDDARTKWERLIARNPTSARGHARLGDLYFCVGDDYVVDLERARVYYAEAHEINKEETGNLLRLGELALAAGEWSAAKRYFEDVIASNTGSTEVPFFLAYIARSAGSGSEMRHWLNRARTAEQPETPEGMTGEGDTRTHDPQFERAGCAELHTLVEGFERTPAKQLQADAERRFKKLDRWLELRREATATE